MILGVIGWIVVGLIVGFVASKAVDLHGDDPRLGIGAAVGGAFVAAILFRAFSGVAVTAWNPWSLLCATLGAVAAVVIFHIVRSRYVSHETFTHRRSY